MRMISGACMQVPNAQNVRYVPPAEEITDASPDKWALYPGGWGAGDLFLDDQRRLVCFKDNFTATGAAPSLYLSSAGVYYLRFTSRFYSCLPSAITILRLCKYARCCQRLRAGSTALLLPHQVVLHACGTCHTSLHRQRAAAGECEEGSSSFELLSKILGASSVASTAQATQQASTASSADFGNRILGAAQRTGPLQREYTYTWLEERPAPIWEKLTAADDTVRTAPSMRLCAHLPSGSTFWETFLTTEKVNVARAPCS